MTKSYVIPGTQTELKTGTKIVIPVHAIHYDPKYYPDPYAFEPDRFSDENIHNIQPNTYMPFGDGPRFCIGTSYSIASYIFKICLMFTYNPHKCVQIASIQCCNLCS